MEPFDWAVLWLPKWPPWEVALRAAAVYLLVQLLFRQVGRMELGRYATSVVAVLFLITVAARCSIGGDDTSLTSAFVALATIVFLDWMVSFVNFYSPSFARLVEGPGRQLVREGALLDDELRHSRISRGQLLADLREKGHDSLDQGRNADLERSGRVSFILYDRPPQPEKRG